MSVVRELRVTDIRCGWCRAGSGIHCTGREQVFVAEYGVGLARVRVLAHQPRIQEHADLVSAGWQWQEVDPTDVGARKR